MKKNSMYDKYHRIELIHALILTINKISWKIYHHFAIVSLIITS